MKNGKKYFLIAALLGVTATTAIWLRGQFAKLKKNKIGFSKFLIKNIGLKNWAFDIVVNYTNTMDVSIVLTYQKFDIYLNNVYATSIENKNTVVLKANATSDLPLALSFDPKVVYDRLGKQSAVFIPTSLNIMDEIKKMTLKIDMKFKVKLLFFNIPISYTHNDTIGRLFKLK